jgi:hypothetical protein
MEAHEQISKWPDDIRDCIICNAEINLTQLRRNNQLKGWQLAEERPFYYVCSEPCRDVHHEQVEAEKEARRNAKKEAKAARKAAQQKA